MTIRVIAIDDHPLILRALSDLLKEHPDIELVGTDNHGSQLMKLVREKSPDVAILDLSMGAEAFDPISAVRTLHEQFPNVKILILTGFDDCLWANLLVKAGASGYILKSDNFSLSIPQAIRTVINNEVFFSPIVVKKLLETPRNTLLGDREISVLYLLSQGLSTETIATRLGVSDKRVRDLVVAVSGKLEVFKEDGLDIRIAAINKARKLGLIPSE